MKLSVLKELPLLAVISLPFIYLYNFWKTLPEKVPLHWNINGEIDRYGDKSSLILVPILLPLMAYLVLLIVPIIDPKGRIQNMGNKYHRIKVILVLFMTGLSIFILHAAKTESFANPNVIVLILGFLFLVMGNYFKTIRANYFIGIRTPWTLESEIVWKQTHRLAGKIWVVGGAIIVIASLILEKEHNFRLFGAITIVITLIPVIYSYLMFKKLDTEI